jgi:dipeptidyl aminopeptidase/acylaminoacyl peptidase
MISRPHTSMWKYAAFLALPSIAAARPQDGAHNPLTMDDVLGIERIERATISPDGAWIATVVTRPARVGNVYGRTAYEVDPSRDDVRLVERRTGAVRDLTHGAADASGTWCATWSPDGRSLAMLSTRPEGREPRGGDNVRLYVWSRNSSAPRRIGSFAMATQTRYGSPLHQLDLRGGADGRAVAHACLEGQENAPFTWLDKRHLLAITLPPGGISGLIDEYSRPFRETAATASHMQAGDKPTVTAVGSGAARTRADPMANRLLLRVIDIATGSSRVVATLPSYPFQADLTIEVAPDGARVAVLASQDRIPPELLGKPPPNEPAWALEKKLGFIDLAGNAGVRWVSLPPEARLALELYGWSPDSRRVAFRARGDESAKATSLFVAAADGGAVARVGPSRKSAGSAYASSDGRTGGQVFWADADRLFAALHDDEASVDNYSRKAPRSDWWLIGLDGRYANLTAIETTPPAEFRRFNGKLVAFEGERPLLLDSTADRLVTSETALPAGGAVVWPLDPGTDKGALVVSSVAPGGVRTFQLLTASGVRTAILAPPGDATLAAADPAHDLALWYDLTTYGTFLRASSLAGGPTRTLLSLNTHLAAVSWGERRLIDYRAADGQSLKAAAILPPGYRPGRRYPMLTWVYPGYRVRALQGDYWLDPYLPGIYNLQLYAARGYVVLIPTMPLKPSFGRDETYAGLTEGILPAVDKMVALGIADPKRLGLFGQSYGGYAVYALITQTNRFQAAVAMAGLPDLVNDALSFDRGARGYPGIEHEKSVEWAIAEQYGIRRSPVEDHDAYWRNSPLAHISSVATPLLMIHGEFDKRGPLAGAEEFFSGLYAQGKTARLLRYWGESHSLAQSPANVRDIFSETVGWFDQHLAATASPYREP